MFAIPQHLRAAVLDQLHIDTAATARDRYPTPGSLAKIFNPKTIQTPALDLVDDELVRLIDTPDARLIITMAPQEGKSVRVAGDFPAWALVQQPDWRIITASYGARLADRNGRAIRRRITSHPELGLTVAKDHGAVSEWSLDGHDGGVFSVGIGGGVTGQACDLLIIDDPIKSRKEAESELYRDRVWDWWTDEASSRFGAGTRVVLIMTRWHHDDLAGRLLERDADAGWRVLNIPAQADHDPAKGETDPLGREPGEFMQSARERSRKQWEQRKKTAGTRTWESLYQGHPTASAGDIFRREWFTASHYDQPLWIVRSDGAHLTTNPGDQLMISVDATFKGAEHSDFVAMQVWLRRGQDAYLLDQVCDRMDFVRTCNELVALAAKWPQAVLKLIEDKANGPAIMAQLASRVPGMVPEEPQGGKVARANAIAPFCEAGNVRLPAPELAPWVGGMLDELASFPNGRHDDQVDGLTQAVNRLLLQPLLSGGGDEVVTDELFDEMDGQGFLYSPY